MILSPLAPLFIGPLDHWSGGPFFIDSSAWVELDNRQKNKVKNQNPAKVII